ncbi:MAG TPA: hypothetical protein VM075_09350 [Anaerolineae bacterium]|nr:hypothetical protein [Anaerolineae bacterium]
MDAVSKSRQLPLPFELRWRNESGKAERYRGVLSFAVESPPEIAESCTAPPISSTTAPDRLTVPPAPEIDPESVDPVRLRLALHSAYDRPEFEILCSELGLDYHDLRGETLETKMLSLIDWHQRRRMYASLVSKVLADRPRLIDELR